LRTQVAQVFGDAQKTTATQRKLVVNLRKIQEACCFEPPETSKKGGKKSKDEVHEDFDEAEFNNEVVRCVVRILCVKKSEPVGDRIIRFLGVFLKHASEKGMYASCSFKSMCVLIRGRPSHIRSRDRRRSHGLP
jgi:condensin complex subunit 3